MKKKTVSVILSGVLAATLLVGCGAGSTVSDSQATSVDNPEEAKSEEVIEDDSSLDVDSILATTDKVRIAASDASLGLFQPLVENNNLADGLGLEIEWVDGLNSGPEIIAAILGGSVDIGKVGDFPVVTNYGAGNDGFEVVSFNTRGTDSLVFTKADSGIKSLEDLKGKVVGTQIGTGAQFQLETSLAKANLTLEDIEVVNLDNGSWQSAFVGGDVDAVCILKDFTVGNEEIGDIVELDETELALQSYLANKEWSKVNPNAVAKSLILIHRIYDFYAANPQEAIDEVLEKYPDASPEKVKFVLEAVSDHIITGDWDTAVQRYTELKDFALNVGTIENDFSVEDAYDPQYVELAKVIYEKVK